MTIYDASNYAVGLQLLLFRNFVCDVVSATGAGDAVDVWQRERRPGPLQAESQALLPATQAQATAHDVTVRTLFYQRRKPKQQLMTSL